MVEVENVYRCVQVEWKAEHEDYIAEVYRLLKDQENKIFDLVYGIKNIMDYVEFRIKDEDSIVVVSLDSNNKVCAFFMLCNIVPYKDHIHSCEVHCAVGKRSWGKTSRVIGKCFIEYLANNVKPIKRITASVPQHNFGVIKLLKDLGLKHEGTLKEDLVFFNKNGEERYYDSLLYSLLRKDI